MAGTVRDLFATIESFTADGLFFGQTAKFLKTLAAANKDDLGALRRHMEVLTESLRGDIHLIAAHVASDRSRHTGN